MQSTGGMLRLYDDNDDGVVSASIVGDTNDSHSKDSHSDTETQYTNTTTDVSGSQFGMTSNRLQSMFRTGEFTMICH